MGSDPSRDNDGVRSDDARFHRGSDPIFSCLCVSVVHDSIFVPPQARSIAASESGSASR
jgi:hypothetical protein